jgi:hypothetical protein
MCHKKNNSYHHFSDLEGEGKGEYENITTTADVVLIEGTYRVVYTISA